MITGLLFLTTKGLLLGIRKLIFFSSFLTIVVLGSSFSLDGLGFGLIIPCDIFAFCASSFKIGFFKGIIDISTANTFPIIIELNNSDFIKKISFGA